jgi:type 1 fimbria pilin
MKTRILAMAAVLLAFAAAPGHAQVSRFLGNWTSVDPAGNLPRVLIRPAPGGVTVQIWGKCTPAPCDWGTQPGVVYSPNVNTNPQTGAVAITSNFPQSFARRVVVIRPVGTNQIDVEVYTEFTDHSGRFNYVQRGLLRR